MTEQDIFSWGQSMPRSSGHPVLVPYNTSILGLYPRKTLLTVDKYSF